MPRSRPASAADGTLEIYNDGAASSLSTPRTLRLRPVPVAEWSDWIREHADRHGLDARLVQAIVQVESGYNHRARSRAGAVGLMQLMPGTARMVQVGDRYDAEQNIRGGVAYLRQMIDRFPGRLELAIAAYNAGPNAVQRHGGIPPYAETRDYVDRVLTLYRGTGSSLMLAFSSGGTPPALNGLAAAARRLAAAAGAGAGDPARRGAAAGGASGRRDAPRCRRRRRRLCGSRRFQARRPAGPCRGARARSDAGYPDRAGGDDRPRAGHGGAGEPPRRRRAGDAAARNRRLSRC